MSTTTTNLNLTKPANNENVDLSIINGNYDIIDQFAGSVPSTSDIPTATSELLNDSNFAVDADYVHTDNNYTTTEKTKLAGLNAVEANPSGSATAGNLTKLQVGGDIYAVPSGGGSGGGHVIENSSGTDMAQEDNLQFIGAYLEDDSTNDRTVVNVVREMTASEYDSLSSAEKEGIIHVTDEYDFDALYMVNGVFIDTNNVIQASTPITSSTDAEYTATEDCVVLFAIIGASNNSANVKINDIKIWEQYLSGSISQFSNYLLLKKGQTVKFHQTYSGGDGNYTVYGIQTSDEIKSDYHIYSTDERVVGEWIDGSIIYERTFELQERTAIKNDYTTFLINDVSVYGIDKLIDFRGYDSNSSNTSEIKMILYPILPLIDSNGHLIVYYQQNNTFMITKFTIQYTKTS